MTNCRLYFLLLLPFLIYACGTLQVEKKRHSKGFYVHWTSSKVSSVEIKNEAVSHLENSKDKSEELVKVRQEDAEHVINPEEVQKEPSTPLSDLYTNQKIHSTETIQKRESIHNEKPTIKQRGHDLTSQQKVHDFSWSFLLMFLLPFAFLKKDLGRSYSLWASENKLKSRWLIAAMSVSSIILSLGLGMLIRSPFMPFMMVISLVGMLIGMYVHYGIRGNDVNRKQKLIGTSLFSTSLSVFSIGGGGVLASLKSDFLYNWSFLSGFLRADDPIIGVDQPLGLTILFVVLGIIVLLGLMYLTAVLSCSLSCNGYGALAVITALSGTFLAFFLCSLFFILAVRKLTDDTNMILLKALIGGAVGLVMIGVLLLFLYLS